jgi:hypothetical protein
MSTASAKTVTVDILIVAREVGLNEAVDVFPEEVIAAAQSAAQAQTAMRGTDILTLEPWPPMRVCSQQ